MWQDRVVRFFQAWPKACASLGLACLIIGVYANSLDNTFVLDDLLVAGANPHVRKPIHEWPGFFSFTPGKQAYRPLRTLSYAVDYQFGGGQPFVYHVSNILYHWLAACLVFAVSRRLLSPPAFGTSIGVLSAHPAWRDWLAFGTALVWALHPIQTDSVTYISGRRDVLAGLFFFMGIYAFLRLRALERPSRLVRWGWAIAALSAFCVGGLAKEVVFIFPAVFFAYDWCREYTGDKSLWQNVLHTSVVHGWFYVPFLPVGILGGVYYYPYLLNITSWHGGGPLATWSTVPRIWLHYVQLLVWPHTLIADYWRAFPLSPNFWHSQALFAVVLIVLLWSGIFWAIRRGQRLVAFSGAWFFITLLPMSHIIPHKEMVAEHYLYIPSFGFGLLVCIGLAQLAHYWRKIGIGLGLVVLLAYTARTVVRNQDWQDELTLWQETIQTEPSSARVHHNLAVILYEKGQFEAAEQSFQRAIARYPVYSAPHTGLAELYLDLRRYDEALVMAQKGVEFGPWRLWPQWILGRVYYQHGEFDKALVQFSKVVDIDQNFQPAYTHIVRLYQRKGEYEKASQWAHRIPPLDSRSLPPGFRKSGKED